LASKEINNKFDFERQKQPTFNIVDPEEPSGDIERIENKRSNNKLPAKINTPTADLNGCMRVNLIVSYSLVLTTDEIIQPYFNAHLKKLIIRLIRLIS
jgi:hypothetical protein